MQKNHFFQSLAVSCAVLLCQLVVGQNVSFQQNIETIAASVRAEVGVGVLDVESGETFFINKTKHLPMQSVYKLHLALAVLAQVDEGKLSLDQRIFVSKSDLLPNTYSPLREKHPEGNLDLPLRDLLRYSVSESDNVACDLLFRLVGGPQKVNDYMHKIGIKDVAIAATEDQMHQDWAAQFTNWTTPRAMLQLLQKIDQQKLFSKSNQDFLWNIMTTGSTGMNRIKFLLPKGTVVAHKTGTSGSKNGILDAINDAAIVVLPNGKHLVIVVFVANSKEDMKTNEATIAQISKAAWDYFGKR